MCLLNPECLGAKSRDSGSDQLGSVLMLCLLFILSYQTSHLASVSLNFLICDAASSVTMKIIILWMENIKYSKILAILFIMIMHFLYHINFRVSLSNSLKKNLPVILIGIASTLKIIVGKLDIYNFIFIFSHLEFYIFLSSFSVRHIFLCLVA